MNPMPPICAPCRAGPGAALRCLTRTLPLLVLLSCPGFVQADEQQKSLKVCADPYMLPFSNRRQEGYENRLADLFARKLGMTVAYTFFPQRMGFIRNTLRAESEEGPGYKCDLVITVPERFELAATTIPYYASTYVLVFAKGRGYDEVTEPQMFARHVADNQLTPRIGLADRGPGQLWVFYQELMPYMTPYQGHPGNPKVDPGHILIKDIVAAKIDAAVVWGPTAGYYAKQYRSEAELVLLPLENDPATNREMIFSYNLSMAVRHGDNEWKQKVNELIENNRDEIRTILQDYGIPLVDIVARAAQDDD